MTTIVCVAFLGGLFAIAIGGLLFRDAIVGPPEYVIHYKPVFRMEEKRMRPPVALAVMFVGLLMLSPGMNWMDEVHQAERKRQSAKDQAMMEFVIKAAFDEAVKIEVERRRIYGK